MDYCLPYGYRVLDAFIMSPKWTAQHMTTGMVDNGTRCPRLGIRILTFAHLLTISLIAFRSQTTALAALHTSPQYSQQEGRASTPQHRAKAS